MKRLAMALIVLMSLASAADAAHLRVRVRVDDGRQFRPVRNLFRLATAPARAAFGRVGGHGCSASGVSVGVGVSHGPAVGIPMPMPAAPCPGGNCPLPKK